MSSPWTMMSVNGASGPCPGGVKRESALSRSVLTISSKGRVAWARDSEALALSKSPRCLIIATANLGMPTCIGTIRCPATRRTVQASHRLWVSCWSGVNSPSTSASTMNKRPWGPAVAALGSALCFLYVVVDRWGLCVTQGHEACFPHEDDSYDQMLWVTESPQLAVEAAGYFFIAVMFLLLGRRLKGTLRIPVLLLALIYVDNALLPITTGPQPTGGMGVAGAVLAFILLAGHLASIPLALWMMTSMTGSWVPRLTFVMGLASTPILVDTMLLAPMFNPLFAPPGYFSHDTNPFTLAPTAIGCLIMAISLALMDSETSTTPAPVWLPHTAKGQTA